MKVEKLDYFGRGIGKVENKIVFVKNALENEEVEIKVIKDKKKYMEATAAVIKEKSEDRVEPKCPYYQTCGGCMLMHMNDSCQKNFKRKKVKEILSRALDQEVMISEVIGEKKYNYRNKVTLHVINGKLGFFENRTNRLIEIDQCLLLNKTINMIISKLRNYVKNEKQITKITIKVGNQTNEVMVILDGNVSSYLEIMSFIDVLIINDKIVTSKNSITSLIGDKKYLVSKHSFFQVNEEVTNKLYEKIASIVKKCNASNVLDLYCGTGTIGIYISSYVDKVIGVEVVEDAINDANKNKLENNVSNITFVLGKVEDNLDVFNEDIDTVIVDPPRNGLKESVTDLLNKKNINTIIYVSCDPITLGRDLKRLSTNYYLVETTPFDMFPNTYHVECVCVLNRR